MNIYEYNSSTINEYSKDDHGLLCSSSIEVFDCEKITQLDLYKEDFSSINFSETLKPFGSIKLSKSLQSKYKKVSSEFNRIENLNTKSIIFSGIILTWYGCGILFELNNELQRQVIPDTSGGGIEI